MKALNKFLLKICGLVALVYGILFAVFYFDLDGKFMYYIWEPFMIKRFDNMKRKDKTLTPYGRKDALEPDEYTQIR